MKKLIAFILTTILVSTISYTTFADENAIKETQMITVSASDVVKATPDKAKITVSINEYQEDANEAQKTISEILESVKSELTDIPEESIATTNYNIYPRYDYNDESDNYNQIMGYDVSINIILSDIDVENAGDIVSRCVNAGVNGVDNIQFYCSNYDELYATALANAVKKTKEKATIIADASDVKIESVYSIDEGYENTSYRYTRASGMSKNMETNSEYASIDIYPEDAEIQANVTATYKIS